MADTRTQCCPMVYVVRWRRAPSFYFSLDEFFEITQQVRQKA